MPSALTIRAWSRKTAETLATAGHDDAFLVSQVLLAHHLNQDRSWLLAYPEFILEQPMITALDDAVRKIVAGYPLPYLLGYWHFYGDRFQVTPHTLIPRPETELLVEHSLDWIKSFHSPLQLRYIDIGTGSGCIPISIRKYANIGLVVGSDCSLPALRIARQNGLQILAKHSIQWICGDLLHFSPSKWDLVTANLPYIPSSKLKQLSVSRFEPSLALDGGHDGLDLVRNLLYALDEKLSMPGLALLEFEKDQSFQIYNMATTHIPNGKITLIKDLAGIERVLRIEKL
ncbi:MAG: peptide chain release factor N(5)-glutamine methyltransferase [Anaerolineae bacterium]|nr:peptide chain release factor N(5)-glutamine methyltransferase [Anaerolineae bacterium]